MKHSDSQRLESLLSLLLDGQLSANEQVALTELLRADPEARSKYHDQIELHAFLRWRAGPPLNPEPSEPGPIATPVDATGYEANVAGHGTFLGFLSESLGWLSQQSISARTLAIAIGLGLAAYFGGLLVLVAWQGTHIPENTGELHRGTGTKSNALRSAPAKLPDGAVAQIVAADECVWSREYAPLATMSAGPEPAVQGPIQRAALERGQVLCLESGIVEIEFRSGARVTLEGPTCLALLGAGACDLKQGRLAALVPRAAVGFTVETPNSRIVDLGTEFGVEVEPSGSTNVHVVQGKVEVGQPTTVSGAAAEPVTLSVGQAVRVIGAAGDTVQRIPADKNRFERVFAHSASASRERETTATVSTVWLGNFFDDARGTKLADAMRTDTFGAAAELGDLAVERVLYAGDPIKRIAPRIQFDFTSLGWTDLAWGSVANDAWIAPQTPVRQPMDGGGIRTTGVLMTDHEPKVEEGIGTHANALITFDLDAIRSAGGWGKCGFRFVCDRAGLNDDTVGDVHSSVHAAILVSTSTDVLTAVVDGRAATLKTVGQVTSLATSPPEPLRSGSDATPVSLDVPASARYLTLAGTSAGKDIAGDHVVWSGARLEVVP